MHKRLLELTADVEKAGARVLERYKPKQLYAFRVGVRRIRSILKQIDSHRSRQYRKIWGGIAAVTNEARDWDVFLVTVKKLVPRPRYQEFKRLNRQHVQRARTAVTELLRSAHWRKHLEEWQDILQRTDEQLGRGGKDSAALGQALARTRLALVSALAANQDRYWHKFRIRVKDVRYVAEAVEPAPANSAYIAGIIKSCKKMQTLLGDWHDTVVQLNLLEELEPSPVHSELRTIILERKHRFLAEAREMLVEHPLFADVPPDPT